ncbi:hypothetical protein [Agromyces sp. SYSU T0242]|uniref:hypothetical protein n=1 Tax=Agromyces litoreus TaxID=3158561 RepID=UPI003393D70B
MGESTFSGLARPPADGDEAAILDRLSKPYDTSDVAMSTDREVTDDGLPETVVRISGLRGR